MIEKKCFLDEEKPTPVYLMRNIVLFVLEKRNPFH